MAWKQPPFKIGDKVLVRNDNNEDLWRDSHKKQEYRDAGYCTGMNELRGKIVTIRSISNGNSSTDKMYASLKEDRHGYNWSFVSFLPVDVEQAVTYLLNGEIDLESYNQLVGAIVND